MTKYLVKQTNVSTFDNPNFPNTMHIYYEGKGDFSANYDPELEKYYAKEYGWTRRSDAERYVEKTYKDYQYFSSQYGTYWANYYEVIEVEVQ